ncbi:MAG TPA: hypothetical protein VIG76_14295 [Amnibacterium sp.]|uniref:hypothetical protein n=1 Tax=Amnibacterium sp. TaxID=1872496 RepID=UPI002F94EDF6
MQSRPLVPLSARELDVLRALAEHGTNAEVAAEHPAVAPLTSFVGRKRERERLTAALAADLFVTTVGPGGPGKTRLARDVLERAATLPAIACRLDGLGASYQAARTRLLAGGAEAARGAAERRACGAAPVGPPASGVATEQDSRS